ncbi:phospholipase D family protein [Bacillus weihaiensis]|uniref:Phospholipase n=1 Tax=Bacillus weihaiensis TaxID=1547283 RepID=A0A1L3MTC6_9BACI|nr:phospholipase D family protein [Bacillus weihaiensis]APH05589.1 phospholipase [Bacillus weihaiensis]
MRKLLSLLKKKRVLLLVGIIILIASVSLFHTKKSLPEGVSYESDVYYVENVEFIYDLTYMTEDKKSKHEQSIFQEIYQLIEKAEEIIVVDMFLFNDYQDKNQQFPPLAKTLTKKLIEQKRMKPYLDIIVITDEINSSYRSHEVDHFQALEEVGISVVYTNLNRLRDPNPLYSGLWRTGFQWFGQEGEGWLPNPMAEEAPNVTLRSYLKLMNIKANHRKVIATENAAIITSANAHAASSYHSNIGFKVEGEIVEDLINTEQAVLNFSSNISLKKPKNQQVTKGDIGLQLLTEQKIQDHVIKEIDASKKGDTIWLAMFYLADTEVLEALKASANRDVKVQLILDPNQNAFGSEKMGLPNLPVAAELTQLGEENITIRWYNTGKEQFHTKMMYIHKKGQPHIIIGGSANFTERNLDNYNLETNVKIVASDEEDIMKDVSSYFNKLWLNEENEYTVNYEVYQDQLPVFKYLLYLIQKMLHFTTY